MAHAFSDSGRSSSAHHQVETQAPARRRTASSGSDEFQQLSMRGGDGARRYRDSDEEEPLSDDDEQPPVRQRAGQRAHEPQVNNGLTRTDFQPGAIVRVRVQNFVTYERAEFSLGPNLNMVIGPNGTGKSSLVCAICLGLGYGSNVLGRASAYGEFVKHGQDEAEIEVELQKKPGEATNHVVGLCIRREDNSRKFTLNRQRATLKDVQHLMKSLRIQIDNLCQFLPQDKVAEFAGLGPVDLLEKTLQAAAPPEMIEWQKELKEHFKSQKEAQISAQESGEQLRKMDARQQVLQADVEKLRERKEIQNTIATLEKLRLIVKYNEARREYKEMKQQKKDADANLKRLQDSFAPSLEAVNRKQSYQAQIQAVVGDRKIKLKAAEDAADDIVGKIEAAENKYQGTTTKVEAEKANFTAKKKEIGRLRKTLTDMEARYKQAPKDFDAADWNRRIREKEHLKRDKQAEAGEIGEVAERLKSQGLTKKSEINRLEKDLEDLESQQGQLLNQLKRLNPDVARGWAWLQNNQDLFEKEVFGPPMLSCSVNNPRYSDLVQSMLQQNDFLCFTTQTKDDHKKLSDHFYGELGLTVSIRSCFTPYSAFKPPLPKSELVRLGLDGYMTDYLEGPEPVLAMLCSSKNIHASAVALADISDHEFERIQQGEAVNQFAAGKQLYRTTRRREYGAGAVSTRVTQIRRGQFWTDQPVDVAEKRELRRKLDEARSEYSELGKEYKEHLAKRAAIESEYPQIDSDIEDLRKSKNDLQREYNKWQALPDKIESEKKTLAQKQEELQGARARIHELEQNEAQAILTKAKNILQHQKMIADIRTTYQALLEAQLLLIEAKSDVEALKVKNSEITQQLEEQKRVGQELADRIAHLHRVATEAREEVSEFLNASDKDELLELSKTRTMEDVQQEIGAEQAKLEVIQASNPYALEEFENWATKIDRERANHTNQENHLAELNDKINTIRGQWEPRLDELVGQINDAFSYNFEQISCAGEVGVHKDEDFEKWAIEIKVKFRENETLQRLDQHRQSGGERAVSTIFYLMSLQSMAQAPFRVVDEINQGMDPRNERMVHERMVEIACREHTSQYFLITPKLLSGLRYDGRMRVHTIVSGEHVAEDGTDRMNFARFLKIQKGLKGK
ncbi:SMC5-like protein [Apodospora peruviana]|uniref:Structural maintenance of chromosomes protein 5 n=1 Tax=Apodospora peruviana TaxID=516989 RepID=A0AAE0MFW2_9PEZI|nr:SMC5-like protein [Apodospora peruviana]